MKKLIILQGLPASGKTTFAKKLIDKHPNQYKRINKDDLRAMIDNSKWSKDNEKQIMEARDALIVLYLSNGKNVIVDDTNFHQRHIIQFKNLALEHGAEIEIKFFDEPLNVCIARDKNREKSVGRKVILDMYTQFLKPEPRKWDDNKETAIIVDIDGTLAKMDGRTPYD